MSAHDEMIRLKYDAECWMRGWMGSNWAGQRYSGGSMVRAYVAGREAVAAQARDALSASDRAAMALGYADHSYSETCARPGELDKDACHTAQLHRETCREALADAMSPKQRPDDPVEQMRELIAKWDSRLTPRNEALAILDKMSAARSAQ